MNLRWNPGLRRFEAEFATDQFGQMVDFQNDLDAVKTAGFKTDGPPAWLWWTQKSEVLQALRTKHRPPSGLTITPEALAVFGPMLEMGEKNQAIKKELAKARKEVRKQAAPKWMPPGKDCLERSDLPPRPPYVSPYPKTPKPDLKCRICGDCLYLPDNIEDKICLFCEIELDKSEEIKENVI